MAEDLQAENNRFHRLFRQFSNESKAVSIATVALVVSALSLLMAWMAVYDAIHARSDVKAQDIRLEQLGDDVATYRFQISLLQADLKARGYEIPEE